MFSVQCAQQRLLFFLFVYRIFNCIEVYKFVTVVSFLEFIQLYTERTKSFAERSKILAQKSNSVELLK